ncbi:MAG TPA: DNA-directed RNA polymerase subunit omega [Candidatus Alectryocaccobium stercorigallinarum]|nr:DNA-directed RNA polymerase subunit omega [Candidatus Alectryocaccobium stercorigallinarum]
MLHPSYYELMEKINEENEIEDVPEITSRYSIVLATSKRARQLTDGAEPKVHINSPKLLSVAVEEFYDGVVHFVNEEEPAASEAPAEAAADKVLEEV